MQKKVYFVCQQCTYRSPKWLGRCPDCQEWNTFVEEEEIRHKGRLLDSSKGNGGGYDGQPMVVGDVILEDYQRTHTGIFEFDRVLGGGIVQGSIVLVGGEPGIGKSTLLMEVSGRLAKITQSNKDKILYVSGEESVSQVAARSLRLGIKEDNFYIFHQTSWQKILEQIKKLRPKYLILDSIQTTVSAEIPSAPGTISQIREVTYDLINHAKTHNLTCFVIGHVTKEGTIAGPKILEHMVDVVIYFEGDQFGHYRMLRVIKNRFGNINEVGLFEMSDRGLLEVKNPSQYFLDASLSGSYGRCLTNIIEGSRTLFVEIQALVVENKFGNGRRTTQGIDPNRLAMLVAIIEKYFNIPLCFTDIYLNVVGGVKLLTRDSDLSIIASVLSSLKRRPVEDEMVFIGEVGLTGEVRSVPQTEMRLKELAQLNYKKVVLSKRAEKEYQGKFNIKLFGIEKAQELEALVFGKER